MEVTQGGEPHTDPTSQKRLWRANLSPPDPRGGFWKGFVDGKWQVLPGNYPLGRSEGPFTEVLIEVDQDSDSVGVFDKVRELYPDMAVWSGSGVTDHEVEDDGGDALSLLNERLMQKWEVIDELRAILAPLLDDPYDHTHEDEYECLRCVFCGNARYFDQQPHTPTCAVLDKDRLLGRQHPG
jgi:hypothetical protein